MTTPINGAFPPPKQIRFVNNQGQPPSKRRRINAAYVVPFFFLTHFLHSDYYTILTPQCSFTRLPILPVTPFRRTRLLGTRGPL